jgi:hypothetical protein
MEIRYMVNKEQIAAIRDYLLDLDCPFNESAVNAMCDLALKGLESPEVDAHELLKRCSVALDDWLNTYAHEMCAEKRVREATKRISDGGGTLAYIADLQQEIRKCIPPQGSRT